MRFPLTLELVEQARRFALRSACRDCFFWSERRNECWHGWPDEGQRRWPLEQPGEAGVEAGLPGEASVPGEARVEAARSPGEAGLPAGAPGEAAFCKEFELR